MRVVALCMLLCMLVATCMAARAGAQDAVQQQLMLQQQMAQQAAQQAARNTMDAGVATAPRNERRGAVADVQMSGPTFWPGPDVYPDSVWVTLNDDNPDATIFYTIDGSAPTPASTRYRGPIRIARTTTIRALAIGPYVVPSVLVTGRFVIR
jgi:hypothetical protein